MMYVGTGILLLVASRLRGTCTLVPALSVRIAIRLSAAAALLAGAPVASAATVKTSRSCYLVGQSVTLSGSGFAPSRTYVVSIDGIYFGNSATDGSGAFSVSFGPGGLAAGVAQSVDRLEATDGTATADTSFTVTRPTGARFLASKGNPRTLLAPFELWGFSMGGSRRSAYLHYVSPSARAVQTVSLGHTRGHCGYLRTKPLRVFPFAPAVGAWRLQIDNTRR
jgi:hypothetical protein